SCPRQPLRLRAGFGKQIRVIAGRNDPFLPMAGEIALLFLFVFPTELLEQPFKTNGFHVRFGDRPF
ncbi:MAG: hypothetical protein RSB98_04705, partial [Raoultibacter sp.]